MSKKDESIMEKIYLIINRGNNVEIRKNKDGSLKVYEVKKNIVLV